RTITQAANEDKWDRRRRIEALAAVADAIHAAHLRGVVHRDLKPANILVNPEGRVRVIDFGIARVLDAADGDSVTRAGEVVGTLRYLAPEQLHGRLVDARMDVYALGVLAYELIHGRSPYGATISTKALLVAIERHAIAHPKPADRAERDLNAVLTRALEMDPAARYESMAAFARDLRALAQGNRVDARPSSTLEDLVGLATRHPIQVALGLLLVVAISIGLVVSTVLVARLEEEVARGRIRMAAAALASGDLQDARSLLEGVEPSERSFEYRLLEREVSIPEMTVLKQGDAFGNHYDILPIGHPTLEIVVTVGGGRLAVFELNTETEIARVLLRGKIDPWQQSRDDKQIVAGELVEVLVAPGSTRQDVRLVGLTDQGRVVFLRTSIPSSGASENAGDEDSSIEICGLLPADTDQDGMAIRGFTFLGDRLVVAKQEGLEQFLLPWEAEMFKPMAEQVVNPDLAGEISALAPLPNGRELIAGTTRGTLQIIDPAGPLAEYSSHPSLPTLGESIQRIVVSPNGRHVVVCGTRRAIGLDLDTDQVIDYPLTGEARTWNACFSPDSSQVALTGRNGRVRIYNTNDWTLATRMSAGDGITWSSLWHDDRLLVTTERNGLIAIEPRPFTSDTKRLAVSPDGRTELRIDDGNLVAEDRVSNLTQRYDLGSKGITPSDIAVAAVRSGWKNVGTEQSALAILATRDGAIRLLYDDGEIGSAMKEFHPITRVRLDRSGTMFAFITEDPAYFLGRLPVGRDPSVEDVSDFVPWLGDDSRGAQITNLFESGAAGPGREAGSILAGTLDGRLITLERANEGEEPVWRASAERFHGAGWIHAYAQREQDVCFIGDHNGLVSRWQHDGTAWQPVWPEFTDPATPDGTPTYPDPPRRSAVVDIALHPTEPRLVALSTNGLLDVYDTDSGERLCTLGPIDGQPDKIVIQDDTLIVLTRDGRSRQWAPSDADAKVESGDLNPEPSTR
ncbi:MAG: hypothetical protein RLZZ461_1227, partial [Planctomycetota bacterium]